MVRRRARTRLPAALTALAVLAACTGPPAEEQDAEPEPTDADVDDADDAGDTPSLGLRVGVVLPPADELDDELLRSLEADVAALGASLGPEIRHVRPYRPDSGPFVADLVELLLEEGTELICVVGGRGREVVLDAAELHPERHYCAAPGDPEADVPDHVELLEVRTGELGHLLGVAARVAAGGEPVGVVLGGGKMRDVALRDGLLAALEGAEVVEVTVNDETDATTAVTEVLAAGAAVVVVDGVPGAQEALPLAAEQALVLAPTALIAGDAVSSRVVASWRIRWNAVLRRPVQELVGGDEPRAPASVGLAEDVVTLEPGLGADLAVRRALEEARAALLEEELDPFEPPDPPPEEPEEPEADPEEDDDSDGAGEPEGSDGSDASTDG